MLEFIKNSFRGFTNFSLWMNLIFFIVGGGVLGYRMEYEFGAFLGIIIGAFIGIYFNIISGGFIAIILNIDQNIEKQNKMQKQLLLHYGIPEALINEIFESTEYFESNDKEITRKKQIKEMKDKEKIVI